MKKLSKQDATFHRDAKRLINSQSRENTPYFFWGSNSQPIFIPKRKKYRS